MKGKKVELDPGWEKGPESGSRKKLGNRQKYRAGDG